ncbi:MAG: CD225/dispanin family protein [Planctomyces sp.]|nr:CD225/dispanin family protein [Planctomyces sp.]
MSGGSPYQAGSDFGGNQGQRPQINNHMVKSILSTIFCCLPLGIVAIVFSAQVNGKIDAGDYVGAQQTADQASKWGNISIGLGVAGTVAYFIFVALAIIGASTQQ